MSTLLDKSSDELAVERTRLSIRRTVMAADNSLMSWIRTALSMISFGFAIYKFLGELESAGGRPPHYASGPRVMGLSLIAIGTVSIVLGTIEFGVTIRSLARIEALHVWRTSFVTALLISLSGAVLFGSILTRVL
jgi:putative membrane protein